MRKLERFKLAATVILLSLLAIAFLAYFIELLTYPGAIEAQVGFGPTKLAVLSGALLLLYQALYQDSPLRKFSSAVYLAVAVLTLVALSILAVDAHLAPNYVLDNFGFHPQRLYTLAIFSNILALLTLYIAPPKKLSNQAIFILPFWFLPLLVLFAKSFPELYANISAEDALVEYATAGLYVAMSVMAIINLIHLRKRRASMGAFYFLYFISHMLFALGTFLVAGEEISWGQRLLGVETPEHLAAINTQDELNLHNNVAVFGYVYEAYFWLAFYGAFFWVLAKSLKNIRVSQKIKNLIKYWAPPPILIGFFIPMMIFVRARQGLGSFYTDPWEETIELLLAAGFFIFMWWNYQKLKTKI